MATKCLCSLGVFGMGVQTCPPKNKLILCYSAVSFLHNICFSFFMIIPSLINVAAEYKYLLMFFCAKLFLDSMIVTFMYQGQIWAAHDNTQI